MTELKKIMDRLQKEDNLTAHQVMAMNLYDYNKKLVERAAAILRAKKSK